MAAEDKTFEQIAQEWTAHAVDITTPGKEIKPATTTIVDAQTGEINDTVPDAQQKQPVVGTVEPVKPVVVNDKLTCPDGFDLNSTSNECVPFMVVENNEEPMPLWVFVLSLTFCLLMFALILFALHFVRKKMQSKQMKADRMEEERLEWERKEKDKADLEAGQHEVQIVAQEIVEDPKHASPSKKNKVPDERCADSARKLLDTERNEDSGHVDPVQIEV